MIALQIPPRAARRVGRRLGARAVAHAQPVNDPALRGAIDIHSHVDPDGYGPGRNGRGFDSLELARLAKEAGMRGFVIKMHYDQSADDAYSCASFIRTSRCSAASARTSRRAA